MSERICADCKHCETVYPAWACGTGSMEYRCRRFRDVVTGVGEHCGVLRSPLGKCGAHGSGFEPKEGAEK